MDKSRRSMDRLEPGRPYSRENGPQTTLTRCIWLIDPALECTLQAWPCLQVIQLYGLVSSIRTLIMCLEELGSDDVRKILHA